MAKLKNHIGSTFSFGPKLTHNQQFKIDRMADDVMAEISMQLFEGNRAEMYRTMVKEWLSEIYPRKIENNEPSEKLEYLLNWYKHQERQEIRNQLVRDYIMLQREPDDTLESSCMKLSRSYGLEWPPIIPDNMKVSDMNNDLNNIKRKIDSMLQSSNGDNVTLRALQRALGTKYTSDELREHLAILSEHGELTTQEDSRGSLKITVSEDIPF